MATQNDQPGNRPDHVPEDEERRKRGLDRRTFIRTGLAVGAGVVASAYVKPSLQSIGIPRAFAQVTDMPGQPSIQVGSASTGGDANNYHEYAVGSVPSHTFSDVELCNVSGDTVVTISEWSFAVTIIVGGEFLDPPGPSLAGVEHPTSAQIGPLTSPQPDGTQRDCAPFPVKFILNQPAWELAEVEAEIKARIVITGTAPDDQFATAFFHVTLIKIAGV